jgi:hypothetical protein
VEKTMHKMGISAVALAWALSLAAAAQAAENFVPMGLGYSPERQQLPSSTALSTN